MILNDGPQIYDAELCTKRLKNNTPPIQINLRERMNIMRKIRKLLLKATNFTAVEVRTAVNKRVKPWVLIRLQQFTFTNLDWLA